MSPKIHITKKFIVTLSGDRVFADIISYIKRRSCWLSVGTTSMTHVLTRRVNRHRHTGEKMAM